MTRVTVAALFLLTSAASAWTPASGKSTAQTQWNKDTSVSKAQYEYASANNVGTICAQPNWQVYSQTFNLWSLQGLSGAPAPSVLGTDYADPVGGSTADYVYYEVTAGSQVSWIFTSGASLDTYLPVGTPVTLSVWLKAVAGAGTMDIGMNGGTYTSCAINATTWTQCTMTQNVVTTGYFVIGHINQVRPALGVYTWGALATVGSTLGKYTVTAGVPLAPAVTGPKGESVTTARSSIAYCYASGTTNISNGDMVRLPASAVRVMPGGDGSGGAGYATEPAVLNSISRSEELANLAWTNTGNTITSDYATAPNLSMTADRFQYTATTGNVVVQVNSTGGVATVRSVHLKGTTTSGAVDFCAGGLAGQCTVCNYNPTTWTRCYFFLPSTAVTQSNTFLGCDVPTKGGACSAAGDVLVWGFQTETSVGGKPTTYYPTVAVGATRTVDAVTIAAASNITSGADSCYSETFWMENTASGACTGDYFYAVTTNGPWGAACFSAWGYAGMVTVGGNTGTNYGSACVPGTTCRIGTVWDWATKTSTMISDGVIGGSSTNALASAGAYGTLTLSGAGVHKQIQIDQSKTKCKRTK